MGNGQRRRPGGASQAGSAYGGKAGVAPGKGSRSQARYGSVQRKEEDVGGAAPSSDSDAVRDAQIDTFVDALEARLDAIKDGSLLAIRALGRSETNASAPAAGVLQTLLTAAANAVLGSVIKEAAQLGGGIAKKAMEHASSVINSSIAAAMREEVSVGSKPPLDAFDEIQSDKHLAARSALNGQSAGVRLSLRQLSAESIASSAAYITGKNSELKDKAQLSTMAEWMNFIARREHGAEEGSDSDVSLGGVMNEHLLDTRRTGGKAATRNQHMKGLMVIKCQAKNRLEFRVYSMELVGMHSAVKREFQEGYATVADAPVNKLIEVHSWHDDKDPTPQETALVGVDGAVRVTSGDTGGPRYDIHGIAESIGRFGLSRLR